MISLRKISIQLLSTCLIILALSSCSHNPPAERDVASKGNCWDSVKAEYQSYFDSVEKCIEKQGK
jgi:hypothetical protein